jgi:hypothetical protein
MPVPGELPRWAYNHPGLTCCIRNFFLRHLHRGFYEGSGAKHASSETLFHWLTGKDGILALENAWHRVSVSRASPQGACLHSTARFFVMDLT